MPTSRHPTLDAVKAIACLLIMAHHLAFYGPMADVVHTALPGLIDWLKTYARMAVQVFLVLGGYWAAAALAPRGTAIHTPVLPALGQRFMRLSLPYSAALMVAIVINETVRGLGFDHPSVSGTPSWDSVLAHLLLLHSLGPWESLSAGVWYVAIDFQLYALCLLWFALSRRHSAWRDLSPAGMVLACAASLWVWNTNPALDIWGIYFLGAYALGMLAWWSAHSPDATKAWLWIAAIATLGGVALWLQWRDRIAVATVTALWLALLPRLHWPRVLQLRCRALSWIGQRSYSIFLIHFPISLLVNAEVFRQWPQSVLANSLGMLLALSLSILAGDVLHHATERHRPSWQQLRHWQSGAVLTGWLAAVLPWL